MPSYLSINEFPGDGVTTQHEFSFAGGYIDKAHVKASIYDAAGAQTPITITELMWVGPYILNLGVSAPVGGHTRIYRDTPREEPLADFADRARLREANLDLLARQAIFVGAEAFDAGAYAEVNDLLSQAAASAAAAAASTAAAAAQVVAAAAQAAAAQDEAEAAAASAALAATFNPALYLPRTEANTAGIADGSQTLQAALNDYLPANVAWNGTLTRNARGFQPSPVGSGVLAANERGHDFWKAGPAGASISSTGGITVLSGAYIYTVPQTVIGAAGDFRISWTGTATCTLTTVGGTPVVNGDVIAVPLANLALVFTGGTVQQLRIVRGGAVGAGADVPLPLYTALASQFICAHVILPAGSVAHVWRSVADTVAFSDQVTGRLTGVITLSVLNNTGVEYRTAGGVWTATTPALAANGAAGGLYETYLYITQDSKTNTYVRKTGSIASNPPLTILASSEP